MRNNFRVLLAKQRKRVTDVHLATGISKSTLISLYYERTREPAIGTLKKVAQYLGVTIDELLNVEDY
ncbi:MAG: helix-turn-helix transcriptional regulator [Streptococcus lutetiensis]|nr:helix-turn-helix transcriptional regulator [Streptococcus lutetiensis]MDU2674619.1 helix-turn-helix transcriptional regulator [Streptococcus lutetiensis]